MLKHSPESTPDDFRRCREILKAGSKSFYAASSLLPRSVRMPISALYAFCRTADEAIDRPDSSPRDLDRLRERLERIYSGRPANDVIERAFSRVVSDAEIPRAVPEAMLEGFEWDVTGRRYETLSDVYAYSARVGATVGAMASLIMKMRTPDVISRACDLGIAMQLTNIARDIGDDARRGRVYIPSSWLSEAGIDARAWLANVRYLPELEPPLRRLLAHADALYERARSGVAMLPRACQPAILSAALIYAEIGRQVERADYDSVSRRAYTGRARKLWLISRAFFESGNDPEPGGGSPTVQEARFLVDVCARDHAPAAPGRPVSRPQSRRARKGDSLA